MANMEYRNIIRAHDPEPRIHIIPADWHSAKFSRFRTIQRFQRIAAGGHAHRSPPQTADTIPFLNGDTGTGHRFWAAFGKVQFSSVRTRVS